MAQHNRPGRGREQINVMPLRDVPILVSHIDPGPNIALVLRIQLVLGPFRQRLQLGKMGNGILHRLRGFNGGIGLDLLLLVSELLRGGLQIGQLRFEVSAWIARIIPRAAGFGDKRGGTAHLHGLHDKGGRVQLLFSAPQPERVTRRLTSHARDVIGGIGQFGQVNLDGVPGKDLSDAPAKIGCGPLNPGQRFVAGLQAKSFLVNANVMRTGRTGAGGQRRFTRAHGGAGRKTGLRLDRFWLTGIGLRCGSGCSQFL